MQKAYPDDVDLRRAFIEMNRWTKFKKDIVHTVQSESLNKKKGYDNTMRKPVLIPVKLPLKATSGDTSVPNQESLMKESDVISTNYLASAEYIFKAAK